METGLQDAGTVLEFKTDFGTIEQVELEAGACRNEGSLYVALTAVGDGYPEPYGNMTVNLGLKIPPYCAFVDTNNMPEAEDFLIDNRLASFTGLVQESGYCTYPLYRFNVERLRQLCPSGMAAYEQETDWRRGRLKKKNAGREKYWKLRRCKDDN